MEFATNLNLLVLFAIIGGIGFLFLLISLVVGDVFEAVGFDLEGGASGTDFGLLDSRVIAVFLTAFGGFGVIAAQNGFGAVGSSIAGLIGDRIRCRRIRLRKISHRPTGIKQCIGQRPGRPHGSGDRCDQARSCGTGHG